MAELDTNQDFGIENTMSVDTAGQGDVNLLITYLLQKPQQQTLIKW